MSRAPFRFATGVLLMIVALLTRIGARTTAEEMARASAASPVTIAPIIRSESVLVSGDGVNQVDVAYNWARSEFLVVYVYRGYSQVGPAPMGLRGQRFSAAGAPIGPPLFIHSGDDRDVSVAYSLQLDRYLVVWPDAGVNNVFGQFLASDGQLLGFTFQVNDQAGIGASATNPDVVSRNFGPAEGLFMVVYQAYSASGAMGAWFRPISSIALEEARLSSADNSVTTQPAVDYDPNEDRFLAVWDTSAGLFARSIGPDGARGAELTVIDGASRPSSPAIEYDSGSRRHLVAWSAFDSGAQFIRGQFLTTAFEPALAGDMFSVHSGGATRPAITAESGSFIVVHEQRDGNLDVPRWKPDSNVHAERIYAHPNFGDEFSLGYLYQDPPGVSPRQDDLWPAVARGGNGFSLFAFQHNSTLLINGVPDGQLATGLAPGQFTHFVHGRSGDIGGSSAADMLVFRPATGLWYMAPDGGSGLAMQWGEAGDMPVLMDVTQDGKAEIGVWRPSNGVWYLANDTGVVSVVQWGAPGDVPVPGDYVGDAADDYAVWRPSTGVWFIRDGTTAAVSALLWGEVGDVPVPADYDGDGKVDLGVWRPSTGYWYTTRGSNGNNGQAVQWGEAGDIPLQGNFVGDHRADQVVFRPRLGLWYRRDGLTGEGSVVRWGERGDIPMPGDFDADGRLDTVVWRAETGTWHILHSSGGAMAQIWGEPGDIPISGMSR